MIEYRLVDFFEPLKAFINLLQLGKPFEEQLKQVEKNFVVMCILSNLAPTTPSPLWKESLLCTSICFLLLIARYIISKI